MQGVAGWLFHSYHASLRQAAGSNSSSIASSPVVQLRGTCRSWHRILRQFVCCKCGGFKVPSEIHPEGNFLLHGNYGDAICRHCHNTGVRHLVCRECKTELGCRLADSDSS